MLCACLAGALLVGLLGNALVGAWWLDPAVGLLIPSPLDGVGFADDACQDECCAPSAPQSP
jgi:hypothetical protein